MSDARTGKIARLPVAIRDEINARLLDGQSARKILPWLNSLPEVKKILGENFEGLAVNDVNLSDWRRGGYADWLRRRENIAHTREMSKFAVDMAKAAGGNLTEGAAAILSGKILEVLEKLDESMRAPDAETPDEAKARLLLIAATVDSLTDSLTSLRTGDQNNRRLQQNEKKLSLIEGRLEQTQKLLEIEQYKLAEKVLKMLEDKRALDIAGSTSSNSEKIHKLGELMFGDDWQPSTDK